MNAKIIFLFFFLFAGSGYLRTQTRISCRDFDLELETGKIIAITDRRTAQNYVQESAYLLSIETGGQRLFSQKMEVTDGSITLYFPSNIKVLLHYQALWSHIRFRVAGIQSENPVDAVIWNINTTINHTVGECVGVVRDTNFAVGIQALNPKTTGGIYQYADGFSAERGNTAVAVSGGSRLEAFSINRSLYRKIDVWNEWNVHYPRMEVKPMQGEDCTGSSIAVFACPAYQALSRIGEIEVAEQLPHPILKGVWIKQSKEASLPYMITNFGEENFDELLAWAVAGGFAGMYHSQPFASWGSFKLSPKMFPQGAAGLKSCVDKAHTKGLRLGLHTLTNFISTNDTLVSPVPDKGLMIVGNSSLVEAINDTVSEIEVENLTHFALNRYNILNTVRIENELICYTGISGASPYKLLHCTRGAWGTLASTHVRGSKVEKLMDHPYKVFFPDFDMQPKVARNLSNLLNETGIDQIDWDGHEGCYATGQGDYALDRFALDVCNQTHHFLLTGSSRAKHYTWHLLGYLNWGEPWYGGLRDSQTDYKINNQAFYERNFLPNMLGWFLLTPNTSEDDINWMMARAAGYNAGFAFVAPAESIKANRNSQAIFELVNLWNEAIRKQVFTEEQKTALKNIDNDFYLQKTGKDFLLHRWEQYGVECRFDSLTAFTFEFDCPENTQAFKMTIKIQGVHIDKSQGISITLDHAVSIPLEGFYPAGTTLLCVQDKLKAYNSNGICIAEQSIPMLPARLSPGKHVLQIKAHNIIPNLRCKMNVYTLGQAK